MRLTLSISIDLGNEKRVSYDGDSLPEAFQALEHPIAKVQDLSVSLLSKASSGEVRSYSGHSTWADPESLQTLYSDARAWLEEHS